MNKFDAMNLLQPASCCYYVIISYLFLLCEEESARLIEMNERKKGSKLVVFIFRGEAKISSYYERKWKTATKLRIRNVVDAFDNS